MKIMNYAPRVLKQKLINKIPKSKGTNQIGDRAKLLAHDLVSNNIRYDEALVRAIALYLRRENHLKGDEGLYKVVEYIQLFLKETKSFSSLSLIDSVDNNQSRLIVESSQKMMNPPKQSVASKATNKPKPIDNNINTQKNLHKNLTILSSRGVNSKSNFGFYLSRKLFDEYNSSLTVVCTNYSGNSSNILKSLLEKNKNNSVKLSLIIYDSLSIEGIEELSFISKNYDVDIKVFDKQCSLQSVVSRITSTLTGFVNLNDFNLDISVEECLGIATYNSVLLPSEIYTQGINEVIEQNFNSGIIVPTYLLKNYDSENKVFSSHILLLKLLDVKGINVRMYQSTIAESIDLTPKDALEYLIALKAISSFDTSELIQKKYYSLCRVLNKIEPNQLLELSMNLNTPHIDFSDIYPERAKEVDTLVIAYNFTPFMDPSAIVVAKRIQEEKWFSDVVANDMSELRTKSEDLSFIGKPYINSVIDIHSKASFAHQPHYQDYIDGALDVLDLGKYERVYSRSFFISAHFLGFEVKNLNPDIYWIAEFSDPGVFDVEKKERYSWYRDLSIRDRHVSLVYEKYPELKQYALERNDNVYFWAELLPYCFADEIIFTCENQRRTMLDNLEIKELISIVSKKSTIKPQPTLPESFYQFKNVTAGVDPESIDIAYFGSFYVNRNFNDIFEAIKNLEQSNKDKLKLHIYTNQTREVAEAAVKYEVVDNIIVNNYLDYLDFLNVLNKFDYLFLMDTKTEGTFEVNPYLPSKLSDYLGADAEIWAHCEKGSTLSNHERITYKSYLNSPLSINNILKELTSK